MIRRLHLNGPLVLGLVLVAGLLVLLALPAVIPLENPHLGRTTFMLEDGRVRVPPLAPGEGGYLLGTDFLGRDLQARLIYGARYTLVIGLSVTLLRTVLAVPLGLLAGYYGGALARLTEIVGSTVTAIPSLLISLVLLTALHQFTTSSFQHTIGFFVVVTLVAVPRLAEVIRLRTEEIRTRPHLEAAVAAGARPLRQIRKHILPLMTGDLLVILSAEMAWVLLMMGQLAVFNLYVGGSAGLPDMNGQVSRFQEYWPEWSMMMGHMRGQILRQTLMPLLPGIALALTAACFHLLSEGLRLQGIRKGR